MDRRQCSRQPAFLLGETTAAHSAQRVMIVDGAVVVAGSFNLTTSADRFNSENLVVMHDPQWAVAYEANFESRLAQSEPLEQYETSREK